jgi:hypothetical protein
MTRFFIKLLAAWLLDHNFFQNHVRVSPALPAAELLYLACLVRDRLHPGEGTPSIVQDLLARFLLDEQRVTF